MGRSVGKVVFVDCSREAVAEAGLRFEFETFIAVGGAQGAAELHATEDIAVARAAYRTGTARIA